MSSKVTERFIRYRVDSNKTSKTVFRKFRMTPTGDAALRQYAEENGYKSVSAVLITGLQNLPGFNKTLRQVIKEQNNDANKIPKDRG